jgi:hypothetical protein
MLKSERELLQMDGADPKDWNDHGGSIRCDVPSPAFSDISLAASLKCDSIIHSGSPYPNSPWRGDQLVMPQ